MKPNFSEKKCNVHAVVIEHDDTQERRDRCVTRRHFLLLGVALIFICLAGLIVVEPHFNIIHKVYKIICSGTVKSTLVQETKETSTTEEKIHPLSDEFIKIVNSKSSTWVAGRNFARTTSMNTIKRMLGVKKKPQWMNRSLLISSTSNTRARNITEIPEHFDARDQWPECASIRNIRDQGGCGSCWAVSSAETMSDRHCIFTGKSFYYSADDILTCCDSCGNGCFGGWPNEAFIYWKYYGIVSGGPYNSQQGCRPYEIKPCGFHPNGHDCHFVRTTPHCNEFCEPNYNKTYHEDRHYAAKIYTIDNFVYKDDGPRELATNGPVQVNLNVYEDFISYKSGVYQHVHGRYLGMHAIKVIGYGIEEGVPYFLCANSWSTEWGDKGFFKISRKEVDSVMITGIPQKKIN